MRLLNMSRSPQIPKRSRGGLAAWQQKVVEQHIEEHLTEPISLAALAQLAHCNLFHFGRAFQAVFRYAAPPRPHNAAH